MIPFFGSRLFVFGFLVIPAALLAVTLTQKHAKRILDG
jgi:hypothetical protein